MNNKEIKERMIEKLSERDYFKQVNDVEYRVRCDFCGDSQKNFNTGHMYVRIDTDDNFPMVYHCFKCEASGIVNDEFIDVMNLDDGDLKSNIITLNKTSDNMASHKFIYGDDTNIVFDYKRPDIIRGPKTEYIEKRLRCNISDSDLSKLKVITSLKEFLKLNKIKEAPLDIYSLNRLEDHYVGFLSFGNSYIMFRDISGKEKFRWVKYPITTESNKARAFYSIESEINVFSENKIKINLAEGVLDIASCFLNLKNNDSNTINIAVCGKHYLSILKKLLDMGLVGENIEVNIYADNDKKFNNNKNNKPTTVEYFKKILYSYEHLYGRVNVFYNTIEKDIGVPLDRISLKKYKIY